MRCFIALGLVPEPGPSLETGLRSLRAFRELSVPPAENLHVTLAFMGDLAEGDVGAAGDALKAAAVAAGGSWKVTWGSTGAFPSLERPRVIWLGLADPVVTVTVQGLLMAELRSRRLPADDRPFRAHLTLARVRRALSRERGEALVAAMGTIANPVPATVEALILYHSTQGRDGSVYQELARAAL